MTKKQPILDELHAVRERLLAESGGTLAGLVARLQAEQKSSDRTILKSRRTYEGLDRAATEGERPEAERESPREDGRQWRGPATI